MFGWLLSSALGPAADYLLGRAAKAGSALIGGAAGSAGSLFALDSVSADVDMTLTGYLIVGLLTGAIEWATVYFKANTDESGKPIDQSGLH